MLPFWVRFWDQHCCFSNKYWENGDICYSYPLNKEFKFSTNSNFKFVGVFILDPFCQLQFFFSLKLFQHFERNIEIKEISKVFLKRTKTEKESFIPLLYTSEIQGLAFLSGTPSLRTGTRPPSCFHLDNRLYIYHNSVVGKDSL